MFWDLAYLHEGISALRIYVVVVSLYPGNWGVAPLNHHFFIYYCFLFYSFPLSPTSFFPQPWPRHRVILGVSRGGSLGPNFFGIDLLQISFAHARDEFCLSLWSMWYLDLKKLGIIWCRWTGVCWWWWCWYEDWDSWSQSYVRIATIVVVFYYKTVTIVTVILLI